MSILATSVFLVVVFYNVNTSFKPKTNPFGFEVNVIEEPYYSNHSGGDDSSVTIVPAPIVELHDQKWIESNLYKVEYYTQSEDNPGFFDVTLVNIESASICDFDTLCQTFENAVYSDTNDYLLSMGVNCQGMTCYLVDWCLKNNHTYAVEYYADHVATRILHDYIWYRFDFTKLPQITIIKEDGAYGNS